MPCQFIGCISERNPGSVGALRLASKLVELPPTMSINARLTRSSCVIPVPSSCLEAIIVERESFLAPGLTFALYSRIERSQICVIDRCEMIPQ